MKQKEVEVPTAEKILSSLEEEKRKLLEMSRISLQLNNYDEIFSDFDPRDYSQRALSDDFLQETKRASRDKVSGTIELRFLVPKKARNLKHESMIKKRLREHFKKHFEEINKEFKKVRRKGIFFIITGIVLMFLATLILFRYAEGNFLMTFLVILLEPGGWFLFWEGLDLIIFEAKKGIPNLSFYKKMSKCSINFFSY